MKYESYKDNYYNDDYPMDVYQYESVRKAQRYIEKKGLERYQRSLFQTGLIGISLLLIALIVGA